MSIAEWNSLDPEADPVIDPADEDGEEIQTPAPSANEADGTNGHAQERQLHRIASVRRQQGVSYRNVARQLNLDVATVRQQEDESADLPLSVLYQWQRILEVPISELLVDCDGPLSPPVLERARMVKVMKTVAAIVEKARSPSIKRLVQMLCNQLLEIMPELSDVAPWHSIGQRRTLEEYGRAVERQVPDEIFRRNGR